MSFLAVYLVRHLHNARLASLASRWSFRTPNPPPALGIIYKRIPGPPQLLNDVVPAPLMLTRGVGPILGKRLGGLLVG